MAEKLRVLPLGGLGEIGKNMMVIESNDDLIVVDAGLMFPDEDMLGVDLVIPDVTYVEERLHKLRAILITHGHEDHTGALPYVLPRLRLPNGNTPPPSCPTRRMRTRPATPPPSSPSRRRWTASWPTPPAG